MHTNAKITLSLQYVSLHKSYICMHGHRVQYEYLKLFIQCGGLHTKSSAKFASAVAELRELDVNKNCITIDMLDSK